MRDKKSLTLADLIKTENQRLRELDERFLPESRRGIYRSAKNIAAGSAAYGDIAAGAINPFWTRIGGEEFGMPSEYIRESFDEATGGLTKPRNFGERVQDTAQEFATPGFAAKLAKGAGSFGKIAEHLSPKNLKELLSAASAGGGLETARELYPDNPLIQFGSSLLASFIPGGVEKGSKGVAKIQSKVAPLPKQAALNTHANLDLNEAIPRKEAAERLGFDLRPAEATGSPFVASAEGNAGVHPETSEKLYQSSKTRQPKIEKSIEDLHESIAPEGTVARKDALYAEAEPILLPDKTFTKLLEDEPIIAEALQKVLGSKIYKSSLEGFQSSSTKVLDLVKRELDDQIAAFTKGGEKGKASLLSKARKKLLKEVDAVNPVYPKARAEDMKLKIVDEIKGKAGSVNEGGSNFFNKVLKDKNYLKKLMEKLRDNPDAQKRLQDMNLAFKDLIEPISTKQAASQAQGAPKTFSLSKFSKDLIDKFTNGAYDREFVDLILDPQWDKQLKAAKNIKNPEKKAQAFESLFNNVKQASVHADKEFSKKIENNISDEELDKLYQQSISKSATKSVLDSISDEELDALYQQTLSQQ